MHEEEVRGSSLASCEGPFLPTVQVEAANTLLKWQPWQHPKP